MMSNIIEESDIFNELLNWAHEGAPDAIKQEDIEEVINLTTVSEAITQDTIFTKDAISEIKTQIALIETRSNQIDFAIQNITQITIAIDKMKVELELTATNQLEDRYSIIHRIMMFEISYVVISRAFLESVEVAETAIINMVEKTITIAVMIAAIDKTNKNAEIVVDKLTELMVAWKNKTNEAEIAKNAVITYITSIQTPTSLLNLPEIITAYTAEINKRSICNTLMDIVKQWVSEYP
jgi:hypothetical protein